MCIQVTADPVGEHKNKKQCHISLWHEVFNGSRNIRPLKMWSVDDLLQDHVKRFTDLNSGKQACQMHVKTLRSTDLLTLLLMLSILLGAVGNDGT